MKIGFIVFGFCSVLLLSAFSNVNNLTSPKVKTGWYGGCGEEDLKTSKVRLYLGEDSTFKFHSEMYIEGIANVEGKWKLEKEIVVLYDYETTFIIHDHWKLDGESCARSVKKKGTGLAAFRLCNCAP